MLIKMAWNVFLTHRGVLPVDWHTTLTEHGIDADVIVSEFEEDYKAHGLCD